jgi:hypothetical protein
MINIYFKTLLSKRNVLWGLINIHLKTLLGRRRRRRRRLSNNRLLLCWLSTAEVNLANATPDALGI